LSSADLPKSEKAVHFLNSLKLENIFGKLRIFNIFTNGGDPKLKFSMRNM